MCAVARLVDAMNVVQTGRAVETQAHEHAMLGEQSRPFVVEQDPVGLHAVQKCLAWSPHPFGHLDRRAEELDTHEGRLAALPRDVHVAIGLGVEQLLDVRGEGGRRHAMALVRIQRVLRQEEAVRTVEIAGGSGGFGQKMERASRHDVMIPTCDATAADCPGHRPEHRSGRLRATTPGRTGEQGDRRRRCVCRRRSR